MIRVKFHVVVFAMRRLAWRERCGPVIMGCPVEQLCWATAYLRLTEIIWIFSLSQDGCWNCP
jgi:hypothetical protein